MRKRSFDFYAISKIYFEIKYTEAAFGRVKFDTNHMEKFLLVYEYLLKDNRYIKGEYNTQNFFLKNYQIMRNLVHIRDNCFVVFFIPK